MKFKYNIFLMALSVFSLWFVSCDEYRDADELDDQLYQIGRASCRERV